MRRVAITGMGCVSAMGCGVAAFWEGLLAGRSGERRITLFDPEALSVPVAAEVPGYDPQQHFSTKKLDLLDRFTQFALLAAGEALRDAGLEPPAGDPSPSQEDSEITKQLVDAGKLLGIEVKDHVIVSRSNYFSFKEHKLI